MDTFWAEFQFTEYSKILIANLALVPAPLIASLYIGVMANRTLREKKQAAFAGALAYFIIMALFIFFGFSILSGFGITLCAFRMAGGMLLMLIALDLLTSGKNAAALGADDSTTGAYTLGIVPLAMPILAGPGAISSIIVFAEAHDEAGIAHKVLVLGVAASIAIYIYVTFRFAAMTDRLFSDNVVLIVNRVMGLIIAAIAFEFLLDGFAAHFPGIETIHDHAGH